MLHVFFFEWILPARTTAFEPLTATVFTGLIVAIVIIRNKLWCEAQQTPPPAAT